MPLPKRLVGKQSVSHSRSPKQESELAKRLGGRATAGSGNKAEKGDVRVSGVVRVEAKTTKNKSYSLTLDTVRKLEDSIIGSNEIPAFVIEFIDEKGTPIKELAVVPTWVLDTIIDV